ncbi:MAG: mandelate racemase/muconate lactonizing enzyme family protein [Terriglobia bacterium]
MDRRDFLRGTAVGIPLQAAAMQVPAPQYTGKPELKITDIQAFLVNVGHNYVYVKVSTDQGIHGWGEAYPGGPDAAVMANVLDFKDWLVGKDPRNIEYLWATMYNFSRFPGGLVVNAAISGIELALWDIAGKAAGLPVHMLLGGKCRNKVRTYQAANTPEVAEKLIEKYGYTAIKASFGFPDTVPQNAALDSFGAQAEALRKALGPSVDLCFDAHAKVWAPYLAYDLAEILKPVRPLFLEEALRPENMASMAELRRKVQIPIATGEELYTKYQFQQLLSLGGADIIQPDVCLAGGMLEHKKIAAIAESHYVQVAPHNPLSPLATIVNIHFAASTPNFLILEYHPDDESPRKDLVMGEAIVAKDGYLEIPDKPGWGYEMNEEVFKRLPGKTWHRGFSFTPDGAPSFI